MLTVSASRKCYRLLLPQKSRESCTTHSLNPKEQEGKRIVEMARARNSNTSLLRENEHDLVFPKATGTLLGR